jgi:hypothetical protein
MEQEQMKIHKKISKKEIKELGDKEKWVKCSERKANTMIL